MDKLAKSIIRELHSENPREDIACTYTGSFEYLGTFTIEELAERVGASVTNTRLAVKYLEEIGYAEPVYYGSSSANKKVCGFRLSHRGNHCKEIVLEKFFKTIFIDVILTLIVSVLGTIITNALIL